MWKGCEWVELLVARASLTEPGIILQHNIEIYKQTYLKVNEKKAC